MRQEQIYMHWEVSYVEDKRQLFHHEHLSVCQVPARL